MDFVAQWMIGALFALCALVIYFIPLFVAIGRRGAGGPIVINVFLGWTFLGWVIALAWAASLPYEPKPPPADRPAAGPTGPRFIIDGIDRTTGDAKRIAIEAPSQDDAVKIAGKRVHVTGVWKS